MLVFGRRVGQNVMIGPDIQISVLEVRGKKVRLGITAPGSVSINREEIVAKEFEPVRPIVAAKAL